MWSGSYQWILSFINNKSDKKSINHTKPSYQIWTQKVVANTMLYTFKPFFSENEIVKDFFFHFWRI